MNFTKMALKTAALALSATVLLTACGKPEESNNDQPSDASAAVSDTASSVPASSDAASNDTTSGFPDDLTSDTTSDTEATVGEKAQSVSLGGHHGAAITEDGNLYLWGANEYGQLGIGINSDRDMPVKVMENVKAVSLGENQSIADGAHSAAITENGDLYLWGANEFGQLGNGTEGMDTENNTPIKVMEGVKAVSLGADHSAAITEDGSLYLWGSNKHGRLGSGTTTSYSKTPVKIMDNVKSVSLGYNHSAAITEGGDLYLWGDGEYGQLGTGESHRMSTYEELSPVKVMEGVKSVSLGADFSAAITEDGSLYMWGTNKYGQLGNGTTEDSSEPIKIMDNVKAVSLGTYHSAAITEDGSLYLWGYNLFGQLGNGTEETFRTPTKIMDHVVSVSLGDENSAAVTEDGSLYLWGLKGYARFGVEEHSCTPVKTNLIPKTENQ